MNTARLAVAFLVLGFSVCAKPGAAEIQVHPQVFAGIGTTAGRHGFSSSVGPSQGLALVIPVAPRLFVRPFGVLVEVNPVGGSMFYATQAGALLGIRANANFSVLVGGASAVLFPPNGTVVLPTGVVSTATRITAHIVIFTPITLNERGFATNVHLGYTW